MLTRPKSLQLSESLHSKNRQSEQNVIEFHINFATFNISKIFIS